MGGDGLILFKRLFRESFSGIRTQQHHKNGDGRPNSPVASANCDMNNGVSQISTFAKKLTGSELLRFSEVLRVQW